MAIDVRRIPADHPDALTLVEAMVQAVSAAYDGSGRLPGPSATPEDFTPPTGAFVAIYEDERPVAGGGVKRLDATTGEIKRMFVVPEARSRGHARRLLTGIEDAARALGYARVRLDTGDRQPHALALYRSAGYVDIPDYNDNPYATYWGEKVL